MGLNKMKKILCDSMLCKNNTSQVPMMSGECMLSEINLIHSESEGMECNNYQVSQEKINLMQKHWDEHEDEGM